MAIPWLVVLRSVPWADVISNAPKVADGAKKLWNSVARKHASPEVSDSGTARAASPEARTIAALEARVGSLEATVSDLGSQMLASAELIKTLAEQNAQLVQRIETNRVRALWLGAAIVVLAIAALFALLQP
jgi:hypothetical protein